MNAVKNTDGDCADFDLDKAVLVYLSSSYPAEADGIDDIGTTPAEGSSTGNGEGKRKSSSERSGGNESYTGIVDVWLARLRIGGYLAGVLMSVNCF